ncbi:MULTISPECIES: DUF456 domain-containing protein [Nosocomiicoccus]|uniref:DUF456 family protein n=1 Tax=Nosocomiicoccus massiliensis TaxID=1232430 RepID=A0AAF1BRC8_9STAP|nr:MULTISPECIES: DUF456 family protein [Nosocomiicoccus]MDK6863589.1 DUF456 family protein [Nosocomiicoccus ampullae]OFL48865.1 hypothetical protein HMPREF2767_06980 [Nosocomiicoccus sp. HMSC067E10]OFO53620.1 hypothetical protein HMPREF3029_05530 [Nosocomiicoccus sp. HMSC059G07]OFS62021.1 hypothetical protein HMPREF3177_06920 [Nosocomiicoccus sp. HMSC09A07]WOS95918.1 DUF456 family protein [Nosocomiicoccus massiliensis]
MEALLWLLVVLSFVIGYVGLVYPVIPSIFMYWLGAAIYAFFIGDNLGIMFWLILGVFTALTFVSDMAITKYYVGKLGGTKQGEWAALIGVVLGMFIYPPLGVIFVPLFLVFFTEFVIYKDASKALKAALGSLAAFVTTIVFKAVVYTLIILWFVLDVFVF